MKDATNQIRSEYDTQVAIDMTVNDALGVMNQWAQETADKEAAEKLTKQLEMEEKESIKSELAKGEAAALKAAIDETRRIKAEAKERETREQRDIEYARSLYDAEEKEAKMSQKILDEDAKFARQLLESESKSEDCFLSEEKCCDSPASTAQESKRDAKRDQKDDYDDEDFVREVSAKFEQLSADEQIAMREQQALERAQYEEDCKRQNKDYLLSRRLAVKTEREALKMRKYREMQQSFERCQRGNEAVANLWENCEAEVEDVCDAVCITLLLPNIIDLKVKVVKNGRKVSIDAKRMVGDSDRFATAENISYLAEFKIQGRNVQISDNSVSHDYASDTGLLHIYIEGVSLQNNEANNRESAEYAGDGAAGASASSKSNRIAMAIKSGFMRVFGAN